MLKKVLKLDFQYTYKYLAIFQILAFISSCVARIFLLIGGDSFAWKFFYNFFAGLSVAMIVNCIINILTRHWHKFIVSIYKDEGYLTHTLPIEKSTIFFSKVISSIVNIFIAVIVAVIAIFISYYTKTNIELLKKSLSLMHEKDKIYCILALTIFIIFLQLIHVIVLGYTSIILGYKSLKNKTLKSLIYGFCFYFAVQIVFVAGAYAGGLFSYVDMVIPADIILKVLIICSVFYIASIILFAYFGIRLFKKGVDVE